MMKIAVVCVLAWTLIPVAVAGENVALREHASALFGQIAPVTAEERADARAELGRALFWDTQLSVNGAVACASCHAAASWGADTQPHSRDARGKLTKRHSQSVFNAQAASAGLRWIADRTSGAEQALGSITGSMGFTSREEIIPVLREAGYADRFRAAYSDDNNALSANNYADALQAYQMTLRTPAPFDRWLTGEDAALDAGQVRGLRAFIDLGCGGCHDGALFGGSQMQVFGVYEDYRPLTGSTAYDAGLMDKTGDAQDQNVFRVQPLRNVATTAPYFHDGSVATLDQAVSVMAKAQLGQTLSDAQIQDVLRFLEALTGDIPPNYRPASR